MSIRVAKSAPKMFLTKGPKLEKLVLDTMEKVALAIGATMGPGGRVVLLEGSQAGLGSRISKDGISVLKNLGSMSTYEHLIMETAVSSSLRTASEAGDGTTTTCVLSY